MKINNPLCYQRLHSTFLCKTSGISWNQLWSEAVFNKAEIIFCCNIFRILQLCLACTNVLNVKCSLMFCFGFFLFKDYLRLVFINKENKKYFPPQRLLTLESGSLHSTVLGKVLFLREIEQVLGYRERKKLQGNFSYPFKENCLPFPQHSLTVLQTCGKAKFSFFNIYITFINLVFKCQIPSNERNIRRIHPSSQEDSSHNSLQHRAPQTYLVITHLLYCTVLLMQVIYYHMQNSYCY